MTLDSHMASAVDRAGEIVRRDLPGIEMTLHAVAEWGEDEAAPERCRRDIARADIVIANMIFLEEHAERIVPWLEARRPHCDCMIGCLSAAEVVKTTMIGSFNMQKPAGGALGLLKRLRGKKATGRGAGHGQMRMLRALPRLLRYIPGKAQDIRAYLLTLQYLLAGSDENIVNLVRFLVSRYAAGPRRPLRECADARDPIVYPDVGLYHPALAERVTADNRAYARAAGHRQDRPTVGLLVMRSYILADNTAHYDGVIRALEARGLNVVAAFASGLDARPAVEAFFTHEGRTTVDGVASLTGFSLIGGPAYNDAAAAEEILARLDVPYLSAIGIEFQSLEEWQASEQGLTPVETTIMVALPEIDGATAPIVFGGRSGGAGRSRNMVARTAGAERLAGRLERMIALRRKPKSDKRLAIVIYNFPPNGGSVGTAAYLSVFRSLHNTLRRLKAEGYAVEVPDSADDLRRMVVDGNANLYGTPANVAATISADDHVRREIWLSEIEAQWGPAPGRQLSDGRRLFVLGAQLGNVFVGVQPPFGYEGDPMRLLFEKSFTPTHAFAGFYRYLREDFRADAVLHFGTHGALEFMPGKQVGLTENCWPDRLLGDLPNVYFYAANNPSEGTIAKRRSAATLITYLTPPLVQAGLYRGLADLKVTLERWRTLAPDAAASERIRLSETIITQAAALDLVEEDDLAAQDAKIERLFARVRELENTLIPYGLHVAGELPNKAEREDMLASVNGAFGDAALAPGDIASIIAGETLASHGGPESTKADIYGRLAKLDAALQSDDEIGGLLRALDGRYIRPVNGGDIIRSPEIAPTGRNMHGFDPFRLPSAFAVADGTAQAQRILARYLTDQGSLPKSVAMVLWGSDNIKSEGGQIAQALALIGARPRFDSFGRLAGADLIALEELGRARVDVVMTLSGIFRDLLPLQTRLLAEAAEKAALADEPLEMNPIRDNALAYAQREGCDLQTAALRVFSNAAGAYGSNVNLLIDAGAWDDEDEIADTYTSRKCFAYGRNGKAVKQTGLLNTILGKVDCAYQNIESVELGMTSIDHYFDTLGGITRAIKRASGGRQAPVYVGDQTSGAGKVRSLSEQVALETRTRALNPKWYEGLLKHGYEGVRHIESHVTNTFGWSATTGQVAPWIYQDLSETFVLDAAMRRRLSELNPKASAKLTNRLIEACERSYWSPDPETLDALKAAGEELEDRVEGINVEAAA